VDAMTIRSVAWRDLAKSGFQGIVRKSRNVITMRLVAASQRGGENAFLPDTDLPWPRVQAESRRAPSVSSFRLTMRNDLHGLLRKSSVATSSRSRSS